jgi:nicotinate-nucleotide--dimethylbenzimidazole phosphoribosyltransferase
MQHLTLHPLDKAAGQLAQQRLDSLAKLPGSLGRLEELAVRLAEMTGQPRPQITDRAVILCAGDHAISRHGLSTAPAVVTALMTRNFLAGGAAINALCRHAGARLLVVDVAIETDLADAPGLIARKVRYGAADFSVGPAMTRDEAARCVQVGIDLVRAEAQRGLSLVAAGEMGIGNTSPSAAITAVLTGACVADVTGRGSGLNDVKHALKIALIEQGIARNQPNASDALDVLAKVGGCEIGTMAGVFLGAAESRMPAVVDGFIAAAAALLAQSLNPRVTDYLIASHVSAEQGHMIAMRQLGLVPLFDLGFRLGEGTGAVMAFPMIDAATKILSEMATMADIGFQLAGPG